MHSFLKMLFRLSKYTSFEKLNQFLLFEKVVLVQKVREVSGDKLSRLPIGKKHRNNIAMETGDSSSHQISEMTIICESY